MNFQRVFLNTLGLQLTRVTIIIRRHFRNTARVEYIHALSWSCTFQNAVPLFYGQAQIDSSNVEEGRGRGQVCKKGEARKRNSVKGNPEWMNWAMTGCINVSFRMWLPAWYAATNDVQRLWLTERSSLPKRQFPCASTSPVPQKIPHWPTDVSVGGK
jgi:hypothetical protein